MPREMFLMCNTRVTESEITLLLLVAVLFFK